MQNIVILSVSCAVNHFLPSICRTRHNKSVTSYVNNQFEKAGEEAPRGGPCVAVPGARGSDRPCQSH